MITLYGAGAAFGLPDASGFVTKTEVQLKMAGLAYEKVPVLPSDGPKGQVPYIDDEGERIADSTFIRTHVERKYGFDFDAGLDAVARAQAWAIERLLENQFYWITVQQRWCIPENFEKGPARFFDAVPEAVRAQVKDETLGEINSALRAVGIGRHSPDEILQLGERSLAALSVLLGDKPYLLAGKPVGVDATAFAMLAHAIAPRFDSPLRSRAETFTNLRNFVDRMMRQYFPESA